MSNVKFANIARLMTTYNLELVTEKLPDNLKCVKCKLVLKDACQVSCGCTFCRVCIDDLMASGSEFCPGVMEDCGESHLSDFATDIRANKSVSKLGVKCPQNGCVHKCELAELEEHIRVCGRKSVACPFHKLGCQQDKLAVEEMSGHLQQENLSHCEILIGMIADINREMESHKREIEILKSSDETNKKKIEMLERSDESRKMENDMLKHELVLKDEKIRSILDLILHVQNEIKSIKDEKAELAEKVRILSDKIDGEIDERRKSDERDMANVIEHVDREITAITAVIGSNKDELNTVMTTVKYDIRSINQDSIKSIKSAIDCIKSQILLLQALAVVDQIDATCEWTINEDVGNTGWSQGDRTSEYFTGVVHPYKYRLESWNDISDDTLYIWLRIHPGSRDARLSWPWSGTVNITVADSSKRETCQSVTLECEISRPLYTQYSSSASFRFSHSSLIDAGLDLARGVRVSCVIVPSCADQ